MHKDTQMTDIVINLFIMKYSMQYCVRAVASYYSTLCMQSVQFMQSFFFTSALHNLYIM